MAVVDKGKVRAARSKLQLRNLYKILTMYNKLQLIVTKIPLCVVILQLSTVAKPRFPCLPIRKQQPMSFRGAFRALRDRPPFKRSIGHVWPPYQHTPTVAMIRPRFPVLRVIGMVIKVVVHQRRPVVGIGTLDDDFLE